MSWIGWIGLAALGAGGVSVLLAIALGRAAGRADEQSEQDVADLRAAQLADLEQLLPPPSDEDAAQRMALPDELGDARKGPRFVRGADVAAELDQRDTAAARRRN